MAKPPKQECKRGHPYNVPGNARITTTKFGKEYRTCRICTNARMTEARREEKIACFVAYGGCVCRCCGELHLDMLTLDHIDGDGGGRERKLGGTWLCRQLRLAGYPSGYQVLCFNCNVAKHLNSNICPHNSTGIVPVFHGSQAVADELKERKS